MTQGPERCEEQWRHRASKRHMRGTQNTKDKRRPDTASAADNKRKGRVGLGVARTGVVDVSPRGDTTSATIGAVSERSADGSGGNVRTKRRPLDRARTVGAAVHSNGNITQKRGSLNGAGKIRPKKAKSSWTPTELATIGHLRVPIWPHPMTTTS